ncbi:MAG: AraC family transcriptional regulator [Rhodobacteraceae bacterium]|nr:AraC family transcriptional regulator [Paracoccaceae bacterium]
MRTPVADPEIIGNRITSHALTGSTRNPSGRSTPILASNHHLMWFTRGGGRAIIDSTQQGFGPNTAMFVPAEILFHLDLSPGTIGWQVSLPATLRLPLPATPLLTSVLKPLYQRQLSNAFVAVQEEFITKQPLRGTALIYTTGLLAVLYNRLDTSNNRKELEKDSAKRRLMRRFVSRLNDRYATKDTVRDYAVELGVTTTHLTRVCRETAGKPATIFIREKTMEEARYLLKETDQKIGAIAKDLGFSSAAYFTRLFTETTGSSPKTFRRINKP